MTDRQAMEQFLGRVNGLLIELESLGIDVSTAVHLTEHGEPGEGLHSAAWSIREADVAVPARICRELLDLAEGIVDPGDLPELGVSERP